MLRIIDYLGAIVVGFIRYVLLLIGLFYLSIRVIWTERDLGQRDFWRQILLQIYFTGVQAAGHVAALGLAVGAIAIIEGIGGIGTLSGAESLGRMITVVVLREIAPLITGGVIIVRSVTAITAELGVMRVRREIEALEVMGISPIRQLIAPRVIGGVISMVSLNMLFSAVSLFGGYLIARLLVSIPFDLFLRAVFSAVTPVDILAFTVKVGIGGVGLFLIACYHGMMVAEAPTDVPIAVSRSALSAFVFLIMFHGTVSFLLIMNAGSGHILGAV